MSSSINKLKTKLGLGARSNKYRVQLGWSLLGDEETIDTLCKGGPIPGKTIGTIEVFNQGRKLVIAGDAEFDGSWTLSFWNTENHELRGKFVKWMENIDSVQDHKRSIAGHDDYMTAGAQIHQLSTSDNSVTASYEFYNMWPTEVAAVEMADETNNEVSSFDVTFAYSHWVKIA